VYDELFERVPDHPQLTRRAAAEEQAAYAQQQVALIRRILAPGGSYVEIGAGDCATVRRVAEFAGSAIAVEVSTDIIPSDLPPNVRVAISDGVTVPVAAGSADLVYSNQLMEHLHPDDAMQQLRNIATALRPGGRYLCITPNRLTGPHDISAGFSDEARGFHLREYTYGELAATFRRAGLSRLRVLERPPGRWSTRTALLPLGPYVLIERLAGVWPGDVSGSRLFDRLLNIRLIAER
jgi:SAM-dependent methyltransferase